MNLQTMSDECLHKSSKKIRAEERERTILILSHLMENERRRLFSKFKLPSLFEYAITELQYSEPEANRRISAMRLLRDLPCIEVKVNSGALSLSNMVLAQTLFSKEKKGGRPFDVKMKTDVLLQLENQSCRKAIKIVCDLSPLMKKNVKTLEYDMIQDESLREKIDRVRGLFAHTIPNISSGRTASQTLR